MARDGWMDGWMKTQIEYGEMRDGIFRRLLIIICFLSFSVVISLTNEKCGERRKDRTVTENHPNGAKVWGGFVQQAFRVSFGVCGVCVFFNMCLLRGLRACCILPGVQDKGRGMDWGWERTQKKKNRKKEKEKEKRDFGLSTSTHPENKKKS